MCRGDAGGCAASSTTQHLGHGLSLQLLRFCATARNVHFLRALPLRIVGQAIEDHDAAILQTLAGITAQTLALPGRSWGCRPWICKTTTLG